MKQSLDESVWSGQNIFEQGQGGSFSFKADYKKRKRTFVLGKGLFEILLGN